MNSTAPWNTAPIPLFCLLGSVFPTDTHFSIPSQISSISTSMSGHLPTMPSFNLNIPQFDRIRPRFTSFTSAATRPSPPLYVVRFETTGDSPTGTDLTGMTTSTTETGTGSASSGFYQHHAPPPPAPSSGSRFAFTRSHTTTAIPTMSNLGLNVNMSGSGYSGFSRSGSHTNMSQSTQAVPAADTHTHVPAASASRTISLAGGGGVADSSRPPGLVRRSTTAAAYGPNPGSSSGIRSSKSTGGPRTRTLSRLSDDERERERMEKKREMDRRPAAYRRFDEVARGRHAGVSAGDDSNSSSGDDPTRRSGLVRSRSKREVDTKAREEERRRLEERGCMSDPEGGVGAAGRDENSDDDCVDEDQPWGLSKELKLCEVSAKDGQGGKGCMV